MVLVGIEPFLVESYVFSLPYDGNHSLSGTLAQGWICMARMHGCVSERRRRIVYGKEEGYQNLIGTLGDPEVSK